MFLVRIIIEARDCHQRGGINRQTGVLQADEADEQADAEDVYKRQVRLIQKDDRRYFPLLQQLEERLLCGRRAEPHGDALQALSLIHI